MTWFADNSPCIWYPGTLDLEPPLRAVGWLDGIHDFKRGHVDPEFFDHLVRIATNPAPEPMVCAGFHECEVCQFPQATGGRNLLVPGDGHLYLCPELIVHYVAAHSYVPPEDFQTAVRACPDPKTMDYKVAYLKNGGRELHRALASFSLRSQDS